MRQQSTQSKSASYNGSAELQLQQSLANCRHYVLQNTAVAKDSCQDQTLGEDWVLLALTRDEISYL
jgi:hypothetical protein